MQTADSATPASAVEEIRRKFYIVYVRHWLSQTNRSHLTLQDVGFPSTSSPFSELTVCRSFERSPGASLRLTSSPSAARRPPKTSGMASWVVPIPRPANSVARRDRHAGRQKTYLYYCTACGLGRLPGDQATFFPRGGLQKACSKGRRTLTKR